VQAIVAKPGDVLAWVFFDSSTSNRDLSFAVWFSHEFESQTHALLAKA
jgi:hypothetical protein